jgi:hypothetical protein
LTANGTSTEAAEKLLDCPVFSPAEESFQRGFEYWVEGVGVVAVALPGFIGNVGSSLILGQKGG